LTQAISLVGITSLYLNYYVDDIMKICGSLALRPLGMARDRVHETSTLDEFID